MKARYLNTASIAQQHNLHNIVSVSQLLDARSILEDDFSHDYCLHFAPNATQCIANLVSYFVFNRQGRVDSDCLSSINPVVANALRRFNHYSDTPLRRIEILTLTDWKTGLFNPSILHKEMEQDIVLRIVDAVQTFGTLYPDELPLVFDAVAGRNVVVGCLHKWLDCSLPLGFILIPTEIFNLYPDLRDHLAALDYLGASIGTRYGFDSFPDTYSGVLAPVFAPFLRIALGLDLPRLHERSAIIETNRIFLAKLFTLTSDWQIEKTNAVYRSIASARSSKAHIQGVSTQLSANGFMHAVLITAEDDEAVLRLSAPVVEMDCESQNALVRIFAGQD